MTAEYEIPAGMLPSEALEQICTDAEEYVGYDGGLFMGRDDALGFIAVLRAVAKATSLVEQSRSRLMRTAIGLECQLNGRAQPSGDQSSNVLPFRPRGQHMPPVSADRPNGGDAA